MTRRKRKMIDSRVIFFCLADEPSTGMDPGARRMLWSTINNSVRSQAGTAYDRAAILTTHSMEEADALSSVVGILVNGRLQCIGTSRELKMTHGNGYQLEITGARSYIIFVLC